MTKIQVSSIALAEVRATNKLVIRAFTHMFPPLGPRSRTEYFRSPPPHPIQEKQARPDQPNPSRGPRSHSGLLEGGGQSPGHGRPNSRMPGLEGDHYITFTFVVRSLLRRRVIDKTHVNLDCSGSAPANAWLKRYQSPLPHHRLQVTPHAVAQLKSVVVHGTSEKLEEIIAHLSHPAPPLESLRIEIGGRRSPEYCPVITTTLFNGDLSSLSELCLQSIRTELPWRNMINLTSFTLGYAWSGETSVRHLLDFFESAPRLRNIQLHHATPTFDGQTGHWCT